MLIITTASKLQTAKHNPDLTKFDCEISYAYKKHVINIATLVSYYCSKAIPKLNSITHILIQLLASFSNATNLKPLNKSKIK